MLRKTPTLKREIKTKYKENKTTYGAKPTMFRI
jgi:hypothetical protein